MDDRSIGTPRMAFIQKNGGVSPRPMPDKGLVPSGVRPNHTVWKATVAVACGSSLRCVQEAGIAIQAIEIQPTRTFGDSQQHLMVAGKGVGVSIEIFIKLDCIPNNGQTPQEIF